MITAEFKADKGDGSISLRMSGHAGAAEAGKDIICAAASILAYTVAQAMQFMYEQGGLQGKPRVQLNGGDTIIEAKPRDESYAEALHTFFVAQIGFHLLSHNYAQYVRLKSFGEGVSS